MDANPIALVVIGIAALIAIIVICVIKFKAFREFWIGLWKDVKSFLGDAVSWIKSHWELLPLIFMGPIGIVVALVKSHFTQIKSIAMSVINDVVGFFRALPGRVISAIAGLGGMLFRAGQNVMRSLISGLTSMIGAVGSSVAGIAGKVAGFFGLSPAKEGPLSGAGAPEVRGAHFSHAFAAGVSSGAGRVAGAAARVAGAAAATAAGGAAAGGGGGGRNELVLTFAEGPFRTAFKASIRNHGGNPLVIGN
jgi:phage-related protein